MLIFWNNVKYLCPIKNNPYSETIECIYPLHKLMKKISKELGENMNDEELKIMLERASKNGVELTFYTK